MYHETIPAPEYCHGSGVYPRRPMVDTTLEALIQHLPLANVLAFLTAREEVQDIPESCGVVDVYTGTTPTVRVAA